MNRLGTAHTTNVGSKNEKQHSYFIAPGTRIKAELEKLLALFSMVGRLLW